MLVDLLSFNEWCIFWVEQCAAAYQWLRIATTGSLARKLSDTYAAHRALHAICPEPQGCLMPTGMIDHSFARISHSLKVHGFVDTGAVKWVDARAHYGTFPLRRAT